MVEELRVRLAEGGRIAIPTEYQQALGLRAGDEVIIRLEEDQVRILIPKEPSGRPPR
jgi:AbrB family looped-hinge helix DNA binding protein